MSEKDEKALPWTSQPRCEYEPWRNRHHRTPWIRSYYVNVREMTAAMIIWNIFKFVIRVFGLLAFIYYVFKPDILVDLEAFLTSRVHTSSIMASPVQKHNSDSLSSFSEAHSLSDDPSFSEAETIHLLRPQTSRRTHFLSIEEADELCSKYEMPRWTDRSKARKVYEFIYIDSTSPEYRKELHIHIAQRYHDIDYFILASVNDSYRVDIGEDWSNASSGNLWPYREKIINFVIQPATKASDPTVAIPGADVLEDDDDDDELYFSEMPATDARSHECRSSTYDAMYLQALPLLTGAKAPSAGDLILISRPDQIPTASALTILHNCAIPPKTSLVSLIEGYHYQGAGNMKSSVQRATPYAGAHTVLPAALLAFSSRDAPAHEGHEIFEQLAYCGPCYGAAPRPDLYVAAPGVGNLRGLMLVEGCCASCEEVRAAWEALPWAVGSADEHVEQCVRERKPWEHRIGFD